MANPLLLLLLLLLLLPLAQARFTPSDNYLLACGATAPVRINRRIFSPDSRSLLRSPHPSVSVISPDQSANPLSRSARIFPSPASYAFRLLSPAAPHILRLHFFPSAATAPSPFHVTANNLFLLTSYAPSNSSLKEFILPAGPTELLLTFTPAAPAGTAFVNAIELVSAPADLISDVALLVAHNRAENYYGVSAKALEVVHRVNVGGKTVTPFNDTLSRIWTPDTDNSEAVAFSGRVMYRKYGASREVAPDSVYNSARVIRGLNGKLEWVLPVRSGFRYLVRMHFCDIASLALNELYFNVYVDGWLAYEDLDLSEAAGQVLASPYYADFAVDGGGEGFLNVTITPSKLSVEGKVSGLLNGLEVMKMSNEVGSLDGEVPFLPVMESPRRSFTVRTFLGSVFCGVVFMSLSAGVFMLMMKLRSEASGRVGWSPLPVDVLEENSIKLNDMLPGKFVYY